MATVDELEANLRQAKLDLAQLPIASHEARARWLVAHEVVLDLERRLAAAKQEEYAVPVATRPPPWDIGAPMPHLLASDHRTFLLYLARTPDPAWDGTYVRVVEPGAGVPESLVLVEFFGCASVRLGGPNDEACHGHPLYERGLEAYSAQEVCNSRWKHEVQTCNSVHHFYDARHWDAIRHFVFWFHDSTFECLAASFKTEMFQTSFSSLAAEACRRLVQE